MEPVELPRREKFFVGGAVVALQAEDLAQVHAADRIRRAHLHGFFADAARGFVIFGVDRDAQAVHGKICRVLRTDLQRVLEMLARSRCTIAIQHLDCTIEQDVGFVRALAAFGFLEGAGAAHKNAPADDFRASPGGGMLHCAIQTAPNSVMESEEQITYRHARSHIRSAALVSATSFARSHVRPGSCYSRGSQYGDGYRS